MKASDLIMLAIAAIMLPLMAYGLASIGEPQASWLVCDILGFVSVCQ